MLRSSRHSTDKAGSKTSSRSEDAFPSISLSAKKRNFL